MNLNLLSNHYQVRRMTTNDIPLIYGLCIQNQRYYDYYPPLVTKQSIASDLNALPHGVNKKDKYYLGFFDQAHLIAVMDLISGYPEKDTAYLGFFMVDKQTQNQGVGSLIINELSLFLKVNNFKYIKLC